MTYDTEHDLARETDKTFLYHAGALIKLYILTSYFKLEFLRNSSTIFRSSHMKCCIQKAVLKTFALFTEKDLCWSLFFNKKLKIFLCKPVSKFQKILTLNICDGACIWKCRLMG